MASADDYAAWIVQNSDKRGTPEFDIVAQAYQQAKGEDQAKPASPQRSTIDELKRQGGLTARYAIEGITALPAMLAAPFNYAFGLPNPQRAISGLLTSAGLPEPETGTERVVGDVSRSLSGAGGAIKAAGLLKPGPIVNAFTANTGAQAAGAAGAGAAGGVAREAGAPPWVQVLAGLGGGFAGAVTPSITGQAALAAGRFAGSAAAPFTNAGQQRIVGNTLTRLADNPKQALANLRDVPTYVEGSAPTTAQASRDIGLAQLERGIGNRSPDIANRYTQQNSARVSALDEIAKSPDDLAGAVKARKSAADEQYGAAATSPLNPDVSVDPLLDLMKRPAFQTATKKAQEIAMNEGVDLTDNLLNNTAGLHYIKMALDDMIGEAKRQGIGGAQQRAIVGVQRQFLDWLDKASPEYAKARQNYASASGPINQMETLQDIQKSTRTAAPTITGEPNISQAKWQRVVTEKIGELGKVLTSDQVQRLKAIGQDLDRGTVSQAGKAVGSNTMQNLTTANILGSAFGNGASDSVVLQTLARPLRWLYQIPEQHVADLLTEAMLNPTTARVMMSKASPTNVTVLAKVLAERYMRMLQGAALGSTTQQ